VSLPAIASASPSETETGRNDHTEEITSDRVIDFIASFRFAMEDGKCLGFI